MSCLRAAVKLLERLELRPAGQGDEAASAVSRLFNKYSSALLGSIETCQSESAVCVTISFQKPFVEFSIDRLQTVILNQVRFIR